MVRMTNYAKAVSFIENMVMCNSLPDVDESVFDNAQFEWHDDKNDTDINIYQYFIIDTDKHRVEWLKKSFPALLFSYSNKLDCYVLCVDHFGTQWELVDIECHNDNIKL